jgi:hypothetical protein
LKIANVLVEVLGLAFVVVGLGLGVIQGHPLGGMVGLTVGVATVVLGAYMLSDET